MVKNTKTHRVVTIKTDNGLEIEYIHPIDNEYGDSISINGQWVRVEVKEGADNFSGQPKNVIATFGDIVAVGIDNYAFHIFTPLEWAKIAENIKSELHKDGFAVDTYNYEK